MYYIIVCYMFIISIVMIIIIIIMYVYIYIYIHILFDVAAPTASFSTDNFHLSGQPSAKFVDYT